MSERISIDTSKLSPEERKLLHELLKKASRNPGTHKSISNPDPPQIPERYALGPRIISVEDWVADWQTGIRAKMIKWKARALSPKKPPITRGIAAEGKYKDKMEIVLAQERRKKGLQRWTDEEWGETIVKTRPEDYRDGALKKAYKMNRKIALQYDLRVYAAEKLDAMPVDTVEQRERKLVAAKRTNEIVGLFIKGIITAAEARSRIDAETAPV